MMLDKTGLDDVSIYEFNNCMDYGREYHYIYKIKWEL